MNKNKVEAPKRRFGQFSIRSYCHPASIYARSPSARLISAMKYAPLSPICRRWVRPRPCLRVARFAEACNVEVAPHFLPELFVHLAAAAPNVTWLEDFPLHEPLFTGRPVKSAGGLLEPGDAPVTGWRRLRARARHTVSGVGSALL